ncbi:MAG TPA: DUF6597 domain-containing transcriptional factor [Vicinamibacterales bacterium]|nr:DUF6597 domain-containing transcriptional factor [Vicinamibacterales bacterium]
MTLTFVRPTRELTPYIDAIWVFESAIGLPADENNGAPPNGCSKLTFAYGSSFDSIANGRAMTRPERRLNFVGTRDDGISLHSDRRPMGCIGIEFRPHGAFPVFGIPMGETVNFLGDADSVLGTWAREVEEVLNTQHSVDQRVASLQERITRQLRSNRLNARGRKQERHHELVAYCVRALESTHGRLTIRELERRSGYSRRYLELLFKQHVGLSPKVLAGIMRFQRFYRGWAQGLSFDVVRDDLYEYFYDQSHFIREFQRITGHPPGEYFQYGRNEFGQRRVLR